MKKTLLLLWYCVYIISMLSQMIDPAVIPLVVLLSAFVVPMSILNIPIAVMLLCRGKQKWIKWSTVIVMALAIFQLNKLIAWGGEKSGTSSFKVLSFNASFFRVPTVFSPGYFEPPTPTVSSKMVDWILSQQADFVLIQEFFNDDRSVHFNNLSRLMESGQYKDYYFINKPRHDNGVTRGLIILSAHPLHHKRELFLGENRFNGAQAAIAEVNGNYIELVNVHLKSSALRPSKNVRSLSGMKEAGKRFFNDGVLKARQIQLVMDSLNKAENPVLVCGDFNSTRFSRVVELMKSKYGNTFEQCGWGFGFTFQGNLKLPLKIDYQFYSEGIAPLNTRVMDTMILSDHFPLVSSYQFSETP